MNRRSLLQAIGLAPLAALLPQPSAEARATDSTFNELIQAARKDPDFAIIVNEHEHLYTDVEVMFADISAHTKATGDIILSADNPHRFPPTMGFWAQPIGDGPGTGWSIPLFNLAQSLKALEEKPDAEAPKERMNVGGAVIYSQKTKAQLLRECFKTQEGRTKLACAFPGQRSGEEHCEAMQRWLRDK
jgi:hypothetical protein